LNLPSEGRNFFFAFLLKWLFRNPACQISGQKFIFNDGIEVVFLGLFFKFVSNFCKDGLFLLLFLVLIVCRDFLHFSSSRIT